MYDKAKTYYVNAAQFILIGAPTAGAQVPVDEKAINGICTPAQDGKSNCRFTIPLADVSAATDLKLRATGLSQLHV